MAKDPQQVLEDAFLPSRELGESFLQEIPNPSNSGKEMQHSAGHSAVGNSACSTNRPRIGFFFKETDRNLHFYHGLKSLIPKGTKVALNHF